MVRFESFLANPEGYPSNDTISNEAAASSLFDSNFMWTSDSWTNYTVTYNPCQPTLSSPKQIFTLNLEWLECILGISGLWDPPYFLVTGNGFLPALSTLSSAWQAQH